MKKNLQSSDSMTVARRAYCRRADLESSLFYMGSVMSFLTTGDETGGRIALMEYRSRPGNEPPPHIHEWENELYYVLEGNVDFYNGNELLSAGPGDTVFLPQGEANTFSVRTPSARMLILVQATGEHPVGLDSYFRKMAEPATSMVLPEGAVTYAMDDPDHAIQVGAENGLRMLSVDEAAVALPQYEGFGAVTPTKRGAQRRKEANK
jgi:quercetin dioxygenase-like cupin family protein